MKRRLTPYLFLAPFLALFAVFFLYPLVRSFALGFTVGSGGRRHFAGLLNYRYLATDSIFWLSLANTAVYVVAFLLVQVPLSLGLAIALNDSRVRGRRVLRFAFFSTSLVGSVFVGVIFSQFLNPRHDLLALSLTNLLHRPVLLPWLTNPIYARLAVLLAWLWLSVGFGMIYLLAALQQIDTHLYEAAAVDGASSLGRFRHVTLPGLTPVLKFLVVVGLINGFQLFELPYVLLQGPGPGYAGFTVVMYLFTIGFQQGNLAYASTIGWGLVVIVAAIGSVRLRRESL